MGNAVRIHIYLTEKTKKKLDKQRGMVSSSKYISHLIETKK